MALVVACAALVACTPELDWREVSVPDGRFSVLLPCKSRPEVRTLDSAAGAHRMTMYACSPKRGTMGVAFTDYSAGALAADNGRARLDAARDALLRNIQGIVRSEEEIAIDGLPARQIYAEGQAAVLKARFLVSGSRLYQIAYVGVRDDLAMEDIDMFLGSFKLLR